MAVVSVSNPRSWGCTTDEIGHREYKIEFLVKMDDPRDGPLTVRSAPGLPAIGSIWAFGNEIDPWAFCYPSSSVLPVYTEETCVYWKVGLTFSTKPLWRCSDFQIEDPLLEPQKVSGSFTKYTEEVSRGLKDDSVHSQFMYSTFEQMRGKAREFDANRPTVKIEQNTPTLGADVWGPMANTVNSVPMWGLPPRCIKLSNVTWERKLFGRCFFYFTRTFEFDISLKQEPDADNVLQYIGFDKWILNESNLVLSGFWRPVGFVGPPPPGSTGEWFAKPIQGYTGSPNPDHNNPQHYIRYSDRQGNLGRALIDPDVPNAGNPINTNDTSGVYLFKQYYPESNFFFLGIPTSLEVSQPVFIGSVGQF